MPLLVGGKLIALRKVSFQASDWEDHGGPPMLDLHGLFHLNLYSGLKCEKKEGRESQERKGGSRKWQIIGTNTHTEPSSIYRAF